MSFVSILRSNIATAASPLIIVARRSWTMMSPSAAAAARRRWSGTWQEVIRQIPSDDPNMVGKLVFEDPDLADTRMLRSMRAEAPLRRRTNFVRHEKQWMRRKRMKMERRYLRLQEGVEELKAYIKFKQDNKPDY